MGRRALLFPTDVLQIKERLWNGEPPAPMAIEFGISESSLSAIKWGRKWEDIPWPDGSTGAMSEDRYQILSRLKTRELADKRAIRQGRKTSVYGRIDPMNWNTDRDGEYNEILNGMNAVRIRMDPPLPPFTLEQRKQFIKEWRARRMEEYTKANEAFAKRIVELHEKYKNWVLTDEDRKEAKNREIRLQKKAAKEKLLIRDKDKWVVNPDNPLITAPDDEILAMCDSIPNNVAVPIWKQFIVDRRELLKSEKPTKPVVKKENKK